MRNLSPVGAGNASLVRKVNNNGKVAKVVGAVRACGRVEVNVSTSMLVFHLCGYELMYSLLRPLLCSDVAMLAAQITGLACLRLAGVADRNLATLVGVEVSASASAVAIRRDRLLVNVVHEGSALGRETRNRNSELDAFAILGRDCGKGAADGVLLLLWQSSNVGCALGVVADYRSRDNSGGLSGNSRSRSNERENLGAHDESKWFWL